MTLRPSSSTLRVRSARVLDVFAALCAIVAVLLLVWPTSNGEVLSAAAREPSSTSASEPTAFPEPLAIAEAKGGEGDSLIAVIVNGNVFSSTRSAPRTRFLPPNERAATAEAAPAYGANVPEVTSTDSLPMLSGIVSIDGEHQALLQMSAADEAPKLYRVNETHAGYRVVRIGPNMVVLASRAGTRTLRLSRGAPPDSLEKQP